MESIVKMRSLDTKKFRQEFSKEEQNEIQDQLDQFERWLRGFFKDSTVNKYVQNVDRNALVTREYGIYYGHLMLVTNPNQLEAIFEQLQTVPEYQELSKGCHHDNTASFKQLIQFRRNR
ncbi:MAG: hypothetical protein PHO46_00005 [Thermoguttaceae bacterium]|nr:hypothetical protein [Thermoguttaceae bacterium]